MIQVEPFLGHPCSLTPGRPAAFIEIFSIFPSSMTSVFYLASGSKKPHPSGLSHPRVAVVHFHVALAPEPSTCFGIRSDFGIHSLRSCCSSHFMFFHGSSIMAFGRARWGSNARGKVRSPTSINRFHQRKTQYHPRAVDTLTGQT